MDSFLNQWQEVHGFSSLSEFTRFVSCIEAQVRAKRAEEVPVDPDYSAGEIYGGRWFKDLESQRLWRLVAPDYPFRGLWEPIKQARVRALP
jgi:hypothetical protein